jgi:hypothetical protein
MNTSIRKYVFGVGISCALAISFTSPSQAFPVLTNTATVNSSMPNMVTDVRYYGRGYGGRYYGRGYGYGGVAAGVIGGLAAGAIIGSAVANSGYYYGPGYSYGPGPYAYGGGPYGYVPAPVYVQPAPRGYYGGGGCWVVTDPTRGYGYYGPCN